MKKETYKKYISLITYAMLLAFLLINVKSILSLLLDLFRLLAPLWIGIMLAFTLNVPMSIIERKVFKTTNKRIRIVSMILSIMIVVLLLLVLFAWVIPDFIDSATYLVGQIPHLVEELIELFADTFKNTELSEYIKDFSGSEFTGALSSLFKGVINNATGLLSNFIAFVVNFVTGTIIAIYFLLEKERIITSIKNILKKFCNTKVYAYIRKVYHLTNKSFHDFITYQCLECLILGLLMFVVFLIFRFPYALTIAFLTTITAIIPIFGATIACIIGAILIGTVSMEQALIFVIVFLIIQQIEGNLIYPRVVGKNVGLPPIVTIIALIIGGEIAGFMGMLLCIPTTSVIVSLIQTKIDEPEKKTRKRAKALE